jgi:hypothetical protein
MLVTLGLLALGLPQPILAYPPVQYHETRRGQPAGAISVWADRERPYRRGEDARIYFRAEEPGYVTVLQVDTDGRIRTLFPQEPWSRTHVRGGRTFEVAQARKGASLVIEDGPGVGYLFAIASPSPFEYHDVTRGDYWDFRAIGGGRIQGDPYLALSTLARRLAPRGNYQYDITPYYVEHRYEYPRFVCYDCHSYASYEDWDPYTTSCARFRMVIYDDPAYYPYRYYQGRQVVVARPAVLAPRYVFKDAEPGVEYVTRLRQRAGDQVRRSRAERGRTSADIGGPGAIPAPGVAPTAQQVPGARIERGPAVRGDSRGGVEGRRSRPRAADTPEGLRPADNDPKKVPPVQRGARNPQSTGEPELRRRKP